MNEEGYKIIEKIRELFIKRRTAFKQDVMNAPTIDAVPVVRCQKCRHWQQHTAVDSAGNLVYLDSGNCGALETNKDDYCSLAVRREDNEQVDT